MNRTLSNLLSMPSEKRKLLVLRLANDMTQRGAPVKLVDAISCLSNDEIAQKAYAAIFQCS